MDIKIAIAQINTVVGDIAGNAQTILGYYEKAKAAGADIVACPELSLIGYPPEDIVLMPSFRAQAMHAAQVLAAKTAGGPALIVGCVWERGGRVYNVALFMDGGKIAHIQTKTMLPNYGIFDELRLFNVGEGSKAFTWRGMKLGMLICEDMWYPKTAKTLADQGAELLIVINASPFEVGKMAQRHAFAARAVEQSKTSLVYINSIGGQDDIVFDGGSFVMSANGDVTLQMDEFVEALEIVMPSKAAITVPQDDRKRIWQAMVLGLRDYVHKNGFTSVILGLSGGIDSAVTAAVAVDALGAHNVTGVLLPSPYTSNDSVEDALLSAKYLGIKTMHIPIVSGMESFKILFDPLFGDAGWMENIAIGGNMQARLRGLTLMSISNRFGSLLLSTGNKSEIAVGYTTLYGDSCGGFNVLKDVYKTQVYHLAHWRNTQGQVIPARSISKAPSAELAPGQTDQDQLPPYDVLDVILTHHIEGRLGAADIAAIGFAPELVTKILKMVRMNEYKRRQSCPGVRVSPMMFGKDRRFPLTNTF
jgi:NAD+ synthase